MVFGTFELDDLTVKKVFPAASGFEPGLVQLFLCIFFVESKGRFKISPLTKNGRKVGQ